MNTIKLADEINSYRGEIEFIYKDKNGKEVKRSIQPNIIKIFSKEILSHRVIHNKVWDHISSSWVSNDIDIDEFSLKYITFGASFDESGNPLDKLDPRFYTNDTAITLGVGAEYDGGMINAIPISEPSRPLKRIERIYYEPSYQPSGTPFLQDDVRAVNNTLVLETTLQKDEYNGFGVGPSDYFTITEVGLVGAKEVDNLGACECDPRKIFLTGDDGTAYAATASGTSTISLDVDAGLLNDIKEGDQIKIVASGDDTDTEDILNQLNPYYLVINKAAGGRDVTLDRVVVDEDNTPIVGDIGVFRDGFRLFSHRVLQSPVKKSSDFSITVRWRIIMS